MANRTWEEWLASYPNVWAMIGFGLAAEAAIFWIQYMPLSRTKSFISQIPAVAISDLRSFLHNDTTASERLVFVSGGTVGGKSLAQSYLSNSSDPDYIVTASGQRAVSFYRYQKTWYSTNLKDLKERKLKREVWKERVCKEDFKVPFVLSGLSSSDCVIVESGNRSREGTKTWEKRGWVCHLIKDIVTERLTEDGYPIYEDIYERFLPLGECTSVVGVCGFQDGFLIIRPSKYLSEFLVNGSKDCLVDKYASRARLCMWGFRILGALSLGVLGYYSARKCQLWLQQRQ